MTSSTVLMNWAGKITVLFFSLDISVRVCRFPKLQGNRVGGDNIGGLAKFGGAELFAFGGDNFGPFFALGLGLFGHGPLHGIRQFNIFKLHGAYINSPLWRWLHPVFF